MKCFSNKWFWVVMAIVVIFFLVVWFTSNGNIVKFFGG
jgi:hypothetical protein